MHESTGIPSELARYQRQIILPGVGIESQRRLGAAHVVIVGVGALGSVAAELLCRAGVGRLTLIDRDVVEHTNLQRQTLYAQADVGRPKPDAAAERLHAINPGCRVFAECADLGPDNALSLLGVQGDPPACIVDGADNFALRYLLNDVSVKHRLPYVYGGAVGTAGTCATLIPGSTPCLRCVLPDAPAPGTTPTCETAGVLGPVTALIASLQAAEAIKLAIDRADLCDRRLRSFDLWGNTQRTIELGDARDGACVCCGQRRYEFLDAREPGAGARVLCGRQSVQVTPAHSNGVDLPAVARRWDACGRVVADSSHVRLTLGEPGPGGEPVRITLFGDGRAIIAGVTDPTLARGYYDRYVGR